MCKHVVCVHVHTRVCVRLHECVYMCVCVHVCVCVCNSASHVA